MSKTRKILASPRTDEELLEGMRSGDHSSISYVYKSCFPAISRMISNNSGTEDEAKDIFQEAVMVLYDKITHGDFKLNSKLNTFLYAVCRRLWLKQLNKKDSTSSIQENDQFELADVSDDLESHQHQEMKFDRMDQAMEKLGEPCNTILKEFYIKNKSMQEICDKLGYTNPDNAKTQKYKCLQRLKRLFFDQRPQEVE